MTFEPGAPEFVDQIEPGNARADHNNVEAKTMLVMIIFRTGHWHTLGNCNLVSMLDTKRIASMFGCYTCLTSAPMGHIEGFS